MSDEVRVLRQRIHELEELTSLAGSVGVASTVDEVLAGIVDTSVKLCHADHVVVLLFHPNSKATVQTLVRSSRSSIGGIDHGLNLLVAGWIEHHGRPLFGHDIIEELHIKDPPARWCEMGSVLAVPLAASGNTLGIINMTNYRGGAEFTQDALRLAETIASFAVRFITHVRLHETLFQENLRLTATLHQRHGAKEILGNSPSIQELRRKISAVAPSSATVLLVGETGTGKELVARAIHLESPRAKNPFVAINCSAIPETLFESELFGHERGAFTGASGPQRGKFELAHEGTLFLDEIAEMPLSLQPKLLRCLEERSFYRLGSSMEIDTDVRVVAASSKDLRLAVSGGVFREDLFHRLNVVPVILPPLRERREDIPLLAAAFLNDFSRGRHRFTHDTLLALQSFPWSGNVRELRNAIERLCIFTPPGDINPSDLRLQGIGGGNAADTHLVAALEQLRTMSPGGDLLEELEKQVVCLVLQQGDGNVSKSARLLGIDRHTLQRRIEKFRIKNS